MTRVQIASQGWGWVADSTGNTVRELANYPVTLSGTVYDAQVGGSVISSLLTDSRGVIPGWLEPGAYTLTVNGTTQIVDAISGVIQSKRDWISVDEFSGTDPQRIL